MRRSTPTHNDSTRAERVAETVGGLLRDVRLALRGLRARPGFTAVVVLTLGLGIGANSAIFSVVHGVLLEPLGFADEDRLVLLQATAPDGSAGRHTAQDVWYFERHLDAGDATQPVVDVALWMGQSMTLELPGQAQQLHGVLASPELFPLLGIEPALGTGFVTGALEPGRGKVALLSDRLFRRVWGGDQSVVGTTIPIDGEQVLVAGVLPPGAGFPSDDVEIWLPASPIVGDFGRFSREERDVHALARLSAGATPERLEQRLGVLAGELATRHPATNDGWGVRVVPLRDHFVASARGPILIVFVAGGLALLVACVNIGNLMLARALGRRREVALRTALGASRERLVRLDLVEAGLLTLSGGMLGLLIATWLHEAILGLDPGILPRSEAVAMNWQVFLFAFAVAGVTGVVFGLLPSMRRLMPDLGRRSQGVAEAGLAEALRSGGRSVGAGRRDHALRLLLVGGEVAMAVALLAAAVLLVDALRTMQSQDPGFDPENLYNAHVILDAGEYFERPARVEYYRQLVERVREIPGVDAAGLSTTTPVPGVGIQIEVPFRVGDGPALDAPEAPRAGFRVVSLGWFDAAGIPLHRGRDVSVDDRDVLGDERPDAMPVVVINRTLAERIAATGREPVGETIEVYFGEQVMARVVGVVGDTRSAGLDRPPRPEVFFAHGQIPFMGMGVTVRSALPPAQLERALHQAMLSIDPDQPPNPLRDLSAEMAQVVAVERFAARLLGGFAALALVLAAIGLYGVFSYWVRDRVREIGVRMALGARRGQVVSWILRQGLTVAGAGLGAGLAAAWLGADVLRAHFQGVGALHPGLAGTVVALLGSAALCACLVPALRASRTEPTVALRAD